MSLSAILLATAVAAVGAPPAAAQDRRGADRQRTTGATISVDLGGGGDLGGPTGVFEAEMGVGFHVGGGLSPELSLILGMAPGNYFGLRPGLHWAIAETPFYLRLALDAAGPSGKLEWRWLVLGGGLELRLTDVVGTFLEADTGIPLGSGFGVPLLARGGVFFSF